MTSPIIIYPCFQECQDFVIDSFWKDIFFACACNKFPKGVRYNCSTGTLLVRYGKKSEAIDLPENAQNICLILLDVFREKLSIYSSKDLQIKRQTLDDRQSQKKINLDCGWKQLKPRSVRDYMILNYVLKCKKKYTLTDLESKKLLTTIQLGFQFKNLISDDVEYSDRKIKDLRGLEFDEEAREWYITNKARASSKSSKSSPSQKFNQSIDRFLREYQKLNQAAITGD